MKVIAIRLAPEPTPERASVGCPAARLDYLWHTVEYSYDEGWSHLENGFAPSCMVVP
jgi:hypothetical protein